MTIGNMVFLKIFREILNSAGLFVVLYLDQNERIFVIIICRTGFRNFENLNRLIRVTLIAS